MVTPDSASPDDESVPLLNGFDHAAVLQFERVGPMVTGAQHAIADALAELAAAVKACGMDQREQLNALANLSGYLHVCVNMSAVDVLAGAK